MSSFPFPSAAVLAELCYLMIFLSFFRDILNFLRSGDLPPRERVRSVYKEAQYYSIGPLLDNLEDIQPLKGEKVRQAFLGLMPYYKGKETKWYWQFLLVWFTRSVFTFQFNSVAVKKILRCLSCCLDLWGLSIRFVPAASRDVGFFVLS